MAPLHELREQFRAAAARDIEARRVVRRRRRRRIAGVVVALLVGGGAAAGATDLIAVGEPVKHVRAQRDDYKPPPGALRPTILVRAKVAGAELPYGVGAYTAKNGQRCLVVGSLLGYTLGVVRGHEFQPYDRRSRVGACRAVGKFNQDRWSDHGRTLLYGVGTPETPQPVVTVGGKTYRPPLGKQGAFLAVFDGDLGPDEFSVDFER